MKFHFSLFSIRCASDHRRVPLGTILTLCLILFLILFVNLAAWIPPLREYSARSTLIRLFSVKDSTDNDHRFLNGIRIFSLLWIIFGHSFIVQLSITDNIVHILDMVDHSLVIQMISGAVFAVDTFFFISGYLFVLTFLYKVKRIDHFRPRNIVGHYLHRYCRLIPSLAFVLLISMHLTPWMGSGPMFPSTTGFELPACRHKWWTTIFFVNNVIDVARSCLPVTW